MRVQDDYDAGGALNGLPTQDTLDNVAAIDWETADTGGTPQHSEDSVEITIEEPNLTIDKVVADADLGPSETTTYTVTIANNGTSTAYDTQWSDTIPAALFDSGTLARTAVGAARRHAAGHGATTRRTSVRSRHHRLRRAASGRLGDHDRLLGHT